MFEQAVIRYEKRPWSMVISLSFQLAITFVVVVVSLWTIERLPKITIPLPPPPIPRIRAVEIVATGIERIASTAGVALPARRTITVPTSIPNGIKQINDPVMQEAPSFTTSVGNGSQAGVAGATPFVTQQSLPAEPPPAVKAPAKTEPPKRVTVSTGVLEAKLIRRVVPAYPPLARAARISGRVQLMSVISRDGTVQNLQVVSGHPLLVKAAVDAVRQWLYSPTLLNGQPVEVMAPIEVNFVLSQ